MYIGPDEENINLFNTSTYLIINKLCVLVQLLHKDCDEFINHKKSNQLQYTHEYQLYQNS